MLLSSTHSGIRTLTLNRPEVFNSFNLDLGRAFQEALDAAASDAEVRCVVVTGAGKAFCAGQDLKEVTAPDAPDFYTVVEETYNASIRRIRAMEKPVIAAVNGHCLGFGLTLATACDFVIASDQATFGFPEVRLGVPTVQGAVRLPQRIGWQHAMELLLTGERIDAARALEIGLVWKVVAHDDLLAEAGRLAERLLAGAPLAVRATKEIARRGTELPLVDAIRFGETMRRVVAQTADAAAFGTRVGDAPPTWTGR